MKTRQTNTTATVRAEILEGGPLHYAPRNELGVVFLFAHLAKRFRVKVEKIQPQFPDCIGYVKTGGGEKPIRIEFEYKSKNFLEHKHKHSKVDWVVCWEHNWPGIPKRLRVIELRKEFGLGFNVWVAPVASPFKEYLQKMRKCPSWSVPSLAQKGDIVLYYSTKPDGFIGDIFRLTGPVAQDDNATWRRELKRPRTKKRDYQAPIRRVCKLKSPIFLEDMRSDRILCTANFVRAQMQIRENASEYWPHLYDRILRRNPSLKAILKKYGPVINKK